MKARNILQAFLLFLLFGTVLNSYGQRWKRYRHEFGIGVGASNYLGDLGGATTGDGSRFGDFQFVVSRPSVKASYKYRVLERVAFKGNLAYGRIYGSDEYAGNPSRENRNLNFRSDVIELSVQGEYYFIKEKVGPVYRLPGLRGQALESFSGYLFGGIGAFYFDPQGQNADNEWVKLAPLNTEGQGLPGGPEDYSQVSIAFPIGFGFKYAIDRQWSIGLEYGLRMTTTDYLDDVSGKYYNPDVLAAEYGQEAVEMADKRLSSNPPTGLNREQYGTRGNPDKLDTYMFGFLTLSYKMKSKGPGRTRF